MSALVVLWGAAVIADSALFSAAVTALAEPKARRTVDMLRLRTLPAALRPARDRR